MGYSEDSAEGCAVWLEKLHYVLKKVPVGHSLGEA